jgi:hypothetical protein
MAAERHFKTQWDAMRSDRGWFKLSLKLAEKVANKGFQPPYN